MNAPASFGRQSNTGFEPSSQTHTMMRVPSSSVPGALSMSFQSSALNASPRSRNHVSGFSDARPLQRETLSRLLVRAHAERDVLLAAPVVEDASLKRGQMIARAFERSGGRTRCDGRSGLASTAATDSAPRPRLSRKTARIQATSVGFYK